LIEFHHIDILSTGQKSQTVKIYFYEHLFALF